MVYTDFKKAFDRFDHAVLLGRLVECGMGPSLIKLFTSYLQDRKFIVRYDRYLSNKYTANSGVP